MSLCHVTYYLKIVVLRTFYFFSLKEPPPKRSCQSVTETSEVEATMSRQEKSPLIQQQVELSTSSQALVIQTTEPFQPADFNFPKKQSDSRISIQMAFGISLASL